MANEELHNHKMSRWSSRVYDHTQVVGLEADAQKLKDRLFEANNGLFAIRIVGMGGLGKTTSAQKVFNNSEVDNHFQRRMWVSVSQSITEEQIMRSMLKYLGDASVGDDQGELLRKISQYLQGLPKGNGSCVIITTRIEQVAQKMGVTEARMHWPKFLSEDDSWWVFCKIAFAASGGVCGYYELEGIGKEIVEKCKCLPLAIKAVGGIMLCKLPYYDEWRRIADNFQKELVENDDSVMASLQLSYGELPSYLKSCFLCFSLYPEDSVITKEQLIHWWIRERFVPVRNGQLVTVAAECFSGLMNRCLIEVVDKTYNGMVYTCKIHDMVRDLLINMVKDDESNGASSRQLGLNSDLDQDCFHANLKLWALLSTTKTGEVNRITSILTILDVSHCGSLEYFPGGLGRLSNLQELLRFRAARSNQLEGCRIAELKSLKRLRKLELWLTSCDEIGDDEVSILLHLQQLQFLTISCFDCHGYDLVAKLDKFSPPQQLHELSLKFFPGAIRPTWLNPISLPRLRYLIIGSGNLAKMNQSFWGYGASAWKLEGIMLESLSDLEEEWSVVYQSMPSLGTLSVYWCPKLDSFPIEDVGIRGGVWKKEEQRI
ncbi:hypothetical protein NE237_016474 [Protea cynaroides]|uniref:NB-ARC domain-containing protein n=1 Tax=Protea cynaroides TaxID=273540 RepID=A0A9Q0K6U1_9MAGN|nr:hypothetical protein NE237_016474 [Protea cynaroides]